MNFEDWFLEVIGIVDEKMNISIDVFDSIDWLPSYQLGLEPLKAVEDRYGLQNKTMIEQLREYIQDLEGEYIVIILSASAIYELKKLVGFGAMSIERLTLLGYPVVIDFEQLDDFRVVIG